VSVFCSSVCLCPAETTEPIEMPFGMKTPVVPRNRVLDGVRIPMGRGTFGVYPIRNHCSSALCNVKVAYDNFDNKRRYDDDDDDAERLHSRSTPMESSFRL